MASPLREPHWLEVTLHHPARNKTQFLVSPSYLSNFELRCQVILTCLDGCLACIYTQSHSVRTRLMLTYLRLFCPALFCFVFLFCSALFLGDIKSHSFPEGEKPFLAFGNCHLFHNLIKPNQFILRTIHPLSLA